MIFAFQQGNVCCAYGTKGLGSQGYDCVMIPGASTADVTRAPAPNSYCGAAFVTFGGSVISTFANTRTVCSKSLSYMFFIEALHTVA